MNRLLTTCALLALAAPAAGAQLATTNFGTLCGVSTGGPVCVTGSAELYAGMLKVYVQNAQGGVGDLTTNGTLHRVTGFGLYYTGASMGPAGVLGGVIPGGGLTNGVYQLDNPGPAGLDESWLAAAGLNGNGGIFGCDDPTGNNNDVSSCSGALVFQFDGIDETMVRMDELGFAFRSQSIGSVDGSYKCYSTNARGTEHSCMPTMTSTPEPATFALLGSGILALGGVGLVRRRRDTQG